MLHRTGDGAPRHSELRGLDGWLRRKLRGARLKRSVDQAFTRGLGTAFRVYVSGLSAFLKGAGGRAEPGHIPSGGVLLHGSISGAVQLVGLLRSWPEHDGLDCGIIPMGAIFRERRASQGLLPASGSLALDLA